MGAYSYKQVVNREDFQRAKAEWEAANGECDGDPGYDGHYWSVTADLLDEKDASIADLLEAGRAMDAVLHVCARYLLGNGPQPQPDDISGPLVAWAQAIARATPTQDPESE